MSRKKSKAKTKPQKSTAELVRDFTHQLLTTPPAPRRARKRQLPVTGKRVMMSLGVPAEQAEAETKKAWANGFSDIEYDKKGRCVVRNNSVIRVREYAKTLGMVDLQHG